MLRLTSDIDIASLSGRARTEVQDLEGKPAVPFVAFLFSTSRLPMVPGSNTHGVTAGQALPAEAGLQMGAGKIEMGGTPADPLSDMPRFGPAESAAMTESQAAAVEAVIRLRLRALLTAASRRRCCAWRHSCCNTRACSRSAGISSSRRSIRKTFTTG